MFRLILINFIIFILLIALVEASVGLWTFWQNSGRPEIKETLKQSGEVESQVVVAAASPPLGYLLPAGVTQQATKMVDGEVIFEVEYQIDGFHRRITPQNHSVEKKAAFVFLGDSNLFGQGVKSDQTLPALFAQWFPNREVYNYGVPGWGPHNILALSESQRLKDEVKQETAIVFYFYMTSLADRLIGTTGYFRWAQGRAPQYQWDGEKLISRGSFLEVSPFRTRAFQLLGRSNIVRSFDINYPNSYSASNFKKVCASFWQLRDNIKSLRPQDKFVVVLWRRVKAAVPILKNCFQKHQIDWVYLENDTQDPLKIHKYESHLSSKGHGFYAEKLRQWLLSRGLIGE